MTSAPLERGGPASSDPEWTLWPEDPPVRDTASPDASSEQVTNAGDGPGCGPSSTPSGPRSSSSRTSPTCSAPVSETSSSSLPTTGSMRGGVVSPQPPWAHRISAGDSSSLLPTATATSYGTNQGGAAGRTGPSRPSLGMMARRGLWPTPRAHSSGPDYGKAIRGLKPGGSTSPSLVTVA